MKTRIATSIGVVSTMAATLGFALLTSTAAMAADSGPSEKDKNFVTKAMTAGYTEVAAGKIAATNSQDPEVRRFADQMITDHTKAGEELQQIARNKGITPPSGPDDVQNKTLEKLRNANGVSFDKLYAETVGVADHEKVVALFHEESKGGKDPELKSFAQKTAPTIEHHYDMAKMLQKSVTKTKK